MDCDDLEVSRNDGKAESWIREAIRRRSEVSVLASNYRNNEACQVIEMAQGSFNLNFTVLFPEPKLKWIVRIPIPGKIMYPEEKLRNEVETLKFIKGNTGIPVPRVIAFGRLNDFFGPFMITEFIEGTPLNTLLRADELDEDEDEVLRHDISDEDLEKIYKQIAKVLLELSQHDFEYIGSLRHKADDPRSWNVGSRPISRKMNEMVRCGGISTDILDEKMPFMTIFSSASDYLLELAEENIYHFRLQRNSATSLEDVQRMYTCRYLFRAITPSFVHRQYNRGPFKLFCDDFRPGNILVDDELRITAVIDWEFSYAAPAQFLYSPPRWLLLKEPQRWDKRDEAWMNRYLSKFDIFLRALRKCEDEYGRSQTSLPLSTLMQRSLDDRTFWYHETAQNCFDVDYLYWSWLDEFCFGNEKNRNLWVHRLINADIHKIGNYLDDLSSEKMAQWNQYKSEMARVGGELNSDVEVKDLRDETQNDDIDGEEGDGSSSGDSASGPSQNDAEEEIKPNWSLWSLVSGLF